MDIKLDTNNDIDLSIDDLVLLDGSESVAQHLRIRFRFFLGEWFLDQRVGIPYFEKILIKNARTAVVTSIFRDVILSTPGVSSVENLGIDLDSLTRRATLTFRANTDFGETLEFTEELIV